MPKITFEISTVVGENFEFYLSQTEKKYIQIVLHDCNIF